MRNLIILVACILLAIPSAASALQMFDMRGLNTPYGVWPISLPFDYCPDDIAPVCGSDFHLLDQDGTVRNGGGIDVGTWERRYVNMMFLGGPPGMFGVGGEIFTIRFSDEITIYRGRPDWQNHTIVGDIWTWDGYDPATWADVGDWDGYPY